MSTVEIMRGPGIFIRAMVYVSCVLSVFFFVVFMRIQTCRRDLELRADFVLDFLFLLSLGFGVSSLLCCRGALFFWPYRLPSCWSLQVYLLRNSVLKSEKEPKVRFRLSVVNRVVSFLCFFLVSGVLWFQLAPDWSSRRASVFSSPFSVLREVWRRL
jgi:hypothetical protein